jgi:hypothetical protein
MVAGPQDWPRTLSLLGSAAKAGCSPTQIGSSIQTATLTCGDGNGREVYAKRIEFTDFPEHGIRFYYSDWVIHLPSEY